MSKQQEIERLKELNRLLTENVSMLEKKVRDMIAARDDDFSHSTVYMEMRRDLLLAETIKDREGSFRRQALMDQRAFDEYKRVLADNRELCRKHGVEYWIGIANKDKWDELDAQRAKREIAELKAALEAKDAVIEHLKVVAAGGVPSPAEHKNGRPKKIDEATQKRVKKLRREGWTLQQIAEAEGISKGSVATITNGLRK